MHLCGPRVYSICSRIWCILFQRWVAGCDCGCGESAHESVNAATNVQIRRYTAEQLYLTLTALPENATMDIDAVEEILTGTNW